MVPFVFSHYIVRYIYLLFINTLKQKSCLLPALKKNQNYPFIVFHFQLQLQGRGYICFSNTPISLFLLYLDNPPFVSFILSLGFFFHALILSSPPPPASSCEVFQPLPLPVSNFISPLLWLVSVFLSLCILLSCFSLFLTAQRPRESTA